MHLDRLLISAPTSFEVDPLVRKLESSFGKFEQGSIYTGKTQIKVLVTGPGIPMTTFHLIEGIKSFNPDHLVHIGVAGGKRDVVEIGQTLQVSSDFFGDIGAEGSDGQFLSMYQLGLWQLDQFPMNKGVMYNPLVGKTPLQQVKGITVNSIPGTQMHQQDLSQRGSFEIESMEGASVFYVSLMLGLPFYALRSISNYIEPRNRESWRLDTAIEALTADSFALLESLLIH